MADGTIRLGWEVDLQNLRDELRKSGAVQESEVKKLVGTLRKELKKVEDASVKGAKETAKAWERGLDEVKRGGEKIASLIGGPVGDLADIVFDLGEKVGSVGTVLGVAGGAAAGAAVAFSALAVGSKAIADAALEARDRLTEQGYAAEIPAAAQLALDEYKQATVDLSREIDLLVVSLGTELAPALTTIATATADTIREFRLWQGAAKDTSTWTGDLVAGVDLLRRGLMAIGTGGATEIIPALRDRFKGLRDEVAAAVTEHYGWGEAVETAGEAGKRQNDMLDQEALRLDIIADMRKEYTDGLEEEAKKDEAAGKAAIARQNEQIAKGREHAAQVEAAEDAWADAQRELAKIADTLDTVVEKETLAGKEGYKAALLALDGYLRQQRELAKIPTMTDGIVASMQDWQAELDRLASSGGAKVQAFAESANAFLADAGFQAAAQGVSDLIGALDAANQRAIENYQEERDARKAAHDEWIESELEKIDRLEERGALTTAQAAAERREAQETSKRARQYDRERHEDERAALLQSWRRTKAIQIAAAIADGIRAAISLIPAFSYAGPFAPGLAAGVATPATAAAVSEIRSQDPPELPMGLVPQGRQRSPDHPDLVAIRRDEEAFGVATPRGSQRLERANRGLDDDRAIQIVIDGRVVQTVTMREADRRARLSPPGQWTAGRRTVYGGRG